MIMGMKSNHLFIPAYEELEMKVILNEDVKKFSVKPLSKKWGFCNYTKRYVTLNVELIKRTPFEIEYVILHELAHLKYPNHGKGFYNYVEKYMPNYRNAEKMLNAKHHY